MVCRTSLAGCLGHLHASVFTLPFSEPETVISRGALPQDLDQASHPSRRVIEWARVTFGG
jgi:hypothetical protein